VVREAVSNAVRHAHSTELAVTITADTDLIVQVVDNGDGIPAGVTRRSGLRTWRTGRRILGIHHHPDTTSWWHPPDLDRAAAPRVNHHPVAPPGTRPAFYRAT